MSVPHIDTNTEEMAILKYSVNQVAYYWVPRVQITRLNILCNRRVWLN